MLLALLLASLSGICRSIRFYNEVGAITDEDITPTECFQGTLPFKCKHVNVCKNYILGIDGICSKLTLRNLARKASMSRAQHDEPRRRAPDASQGNPYFVTQLQNITVTEGDTVTLRCAAAGSPVPRVSISSKEIYRRLRYSNRYRRRQGGFRDVHTDLTIFNITSRNQGWYRCAAVNTANYLISDGYLRVKTDPCLNIQCGELQVCEVEEEAAACVCPKIESCSEEPLHPVCGNDCVSYFNLCSMKVEACNTGQNISIWMENSVCPSIHEPSVNKLSKQLSVQAGASLRLKCGAHGSPQPEVMWYKVLKNGLEEIYDQDMLEIKDVESQQSGKYVCMATNCMHRSIRSNVIKVDVLDIRASDRKICHLFGDPHVTTFSGAMYSFVGACEYLLSMDCSDDPQWFIYGRIAPCGEQSSCLQSVTVIVERTSVQFLQGWIVNNNGKEEIIAPGGKINIGPLGVSYDKDGLVYTIKLGRHGITVTWDGYSSATVTASRPTLTCGLCGGYDNKMEAVDNKMEAVDSTGERSWFSGFYNNVERKDDGVSEQDRSWKLNPKYYTNQLQVMNTTCLGRSCEKPAISTLEIYSTLLENSKCPKRVANEGAPITNTCSDETVEKIVEEECRVVLEGEVFSHCMHNDHQLEFYTRACIRDTCGHDSKWAFCEFLESVKQHCEQETQIPVRLHLDQCPDKAGRKIELIKLFL